MSREGQISKHFRSREGVNSFTRPGRGRAKSRRYTAAFWRAYFRIPQGTIATRALKDQFVDGTSKRAREVATGLKQIGNKSGHKVLERGSRHHRPVAHRKRKLPHQKCRSSFVMELRFFSVGSPQLFICNSQLRTTVYFIMSPMQLIEILIGLTNRGRWQAGRKLRLIAKSRKQSN